MARIRKLVLDVLKPHHPNALTFAASLADLGVDYRIKLTVVEVDEKTETTSLTLEGDDIQFDVIIEAIEKMGASMHSIDEVEVDSAPAQS
ncbi:MAG: DUF211 domain-containing protein [Chromatiales bacterium]|jgi:hypothetical protein